jgi:hypothetical protein
MKDSTINIKMTQKSFFDAVSVMAKKSMKNFNFSFNFSHLT